MMHAGDHGGWPSPSTTLYGFLRWTSIDEDPGLFVRDTAEDRLTPQRSNSKITDVRPSG
jgi:hypothetical protein